MNRKACSIVEWLIIIVVGVFLFLTFFAGLRRPSNESDTNKRIERIEEILNDVIITVEDRTGYYVNSERVLIIAPSALLELYRKIKR